MTILPITQQDAQIFNTVTDHPLQSYEWGIFRENSGIKVIRRGIYKDKKLVDALQLTIHKIPKTTLTIGYLPKGSLPTKEVIEELYKIGKAERCIFIQLEPNVLKTINGISTKDSNWNFKKLGLIEAAHPLFTKYSFILDLTKTEEELLKDMHAKSRYNIKVAQKHGVQVIENNSDEAFQEYWKLTEETTKRQKFYAHTKLYHELQWKTFAHTPTTNALSSHIFTASYDGKALTALLFFVFQDTLYYPYGASSNEHRNVMHSNLAMWEGIKFGKKLGLKKFDMWGAMGPDPDIHDPWYGFHNFKQKFGPDHVAFVGSYDLVINPLLYQSYKVADKLRWMFLKLKK